MSHCDCVLKGEADFFLPGAQRLQVVYDLFREFSQPILKHRSLFCCLSSHEQIPERFTALLALKHPDVPLFAPHLLMKAFQQVRRPYERGERPGKIDRQVR